MNKLILTLVVVVAASVTGCGVRNVGACGQNNGTCLQWYSSSEVTSTSAQETECTASGGATFTAGGSCPSGQIGTCLLDSVLNGKRVFYYSPTWTADTARAHCDSIRRNAGSFLLNN